MRGKSRIPLVLGSTGLIGRAVASVMEGEFPATVSASRAEIDITDRLRLEAEVERLQPTLIINCASLSDPAACEIEPDRAVAVNVDGAINVARAAAAIGARLIHISGAEVFDGQAARPYSEEDATAPLCQLGRTRLEGERRVARQARDHLIVRTSWPFGVGKTSFVDAFRRQINEGGVLRVPDDRFGSPTWTADLATALLDLLNTDHRGLVHFANGGRCSRFEVAGAVIEALGASAVRLHPVMARGTGGVARLPAEASIDTSLFARLTGKSPRDWKIALADYLTATADAATPH